MTTPVATGPASSATVAVGRYRLELSSADDTFALYEEETEQEQARAVTAALTAPAPAEEAAAKAEQALADASTVTERCQRCLSLFTQIAEGHALESKAVSEEVDSLLALLGRLDREGRHKEALRLARDLAALLALLLRWLDLVRSLELALRLARELVDPRDEAWALHELGTLHLAAGDPAGAEDRLGEAVRIKDRLGGAGRCASRHNLDAARRDLADRAALARLRRRMLYRLTGVGAVFVFLATAGAALGVGLGSHNHRSATPTSPVSSTKAGPGTTGTTSTTATTATTATTTTSTTLTTGPATTTLDATAPQPTLTSPGPLINTATPTFTGTAGDDSGDEDTVRLTIADAAGNAAGGSPLTVTRTGSTYSVTVTSALPDGDYTAYVEQADNAGNTGRSDPPVSFTVDTTAPTVKLSCDGPDCMGTATELGRPVTITVTDEGPVGTTPAPVSSTTQTVSVASDGTFTVKVDLPAQSEQYEIVASQSDEAGNRGESNHVSVETGVT